MVAPTGLFSFYGFEERLENSLAEGVGALALNDLIKDGGAVLHGLRKDL